MIWSIQPRLTNYSVTGTILYHHAHMSEYFASNRLIGKSTQAKYPSSYGYYGKPSEVTPCCTKIRLRTEFASIRLNRFALRLDSKSRPPTPAINFQSQIYKEEARLALIFFNLSNLLPSPEFCKKKWLWLWKECAMSRLQSWTLNTKYRL